MTGYGGYGGFGGFEFMFTIMPVIMTVGFVLVFGIIISIAVRGAAGWSRNNNSPVLTVAAKVVAKRTAFAQHSHHHGADMTMNHNSASTAYYVTFEVESGDRMELRVPDNEYGMLVEGDLGKLTFQGTRYNGFERNKQGGLL